MSWREPGNDLFKKKEFSKAVVAYTTALEEHPDDYVLLSNRAEAFLKLKQFNEAHVDAVEVTEHLKENVKGHYRLGRSLIGLDRFEEARTALEAAFALDRSNHAVVQELKSVQALLESRRKTRWSCLLRTVLGEAKKTRSLHSSQDDYVGDVEVRHGWTGKGRGLFATHDIPAATVVLACKPLCSVYAEELTEGHNSDKNDTERLYDAVVDALAERLDDTEDTDAAGKLQDLVSDLSAGNGPPVPMTLACPPGPDRRKAIRKWVEPIVRCNAFASSSWDPLSHQDSTANGSADTNQEALSSIVDGRSADMRFGYGLWNLPSFINHSCLFNAFRFVIGNFFILVSNRTIRATEEITTFYVRPEEPDRAFIFKKDFCFECKCLQCIAVRRRTADARQYMRLGEKLYDTLVPKVLKFDDSCMDDLQLCLTYMRQADDRQLMRPNRLLCNILMSMVLIYGRRKQWQFAVEALNSAYESLVGPSMKKEEEEEAKEEWEEPFGGGCASPEPLLVEIALQLSCGMSRLHRFNEARKWLDCARQTALLLYAVDDVADAYFGHHFFLAEQGLAGRGKKKKK